MDIMMRRNLKKAQEDLLALEMEHYMYEKSGEIVDEILRLFPEIDEVSAGLVIEYIEGEAVTT
jgi:hypothetical protein